MKKLLVAAIIFVAGYLATAYAMAMLIGPFPIVGGVAAVALWYVFTRG